MKLSQAINAVLQRQDLNSSEMTEVMRTIMTGGATDAQMDALKADADYKRAMAALREEELLNEQRRQEAINDPDRYRTGIINARRVA